MNALKNVIFLDNGIVELDLGIVLFKLFANIGLADGRAGGHQIPKFGDQNVLLDQLFELRNRVIEGAGNEIFIGSLADEGTVGENLLPQLALVQILANIIIRSPQAHVACLAHQNAFVDEPVGSLAGEKRPQRCSLRSAAGELLLQHLTRLTVDLIGRDIVSGNSGHNIRARGIAHEAGTAETGNQRDSHKHANDSQEAAKDNFLDGARGLQKANHVIGNSKIVSGNMIIDEAVGASERLAI